MFKRLACGLASPKKIINFIDDKWYMPLLCLLFMVLLYCIPVIYFAVNQQLLTYDVQTSIRSAFANGDVVNYKIEDNQLVYLGEGDNITFIDTKLGRFIFTNQEEIEVVNVKEDVSNFIFGKDKIKIVTKTRYFDTVSEIRSFNYLDIEGANGIDLRLAKDNDRDFFKKAFAIATPLVNEYQPMFVTLTVLMNVGLLLLEMLILVLIIATIIRLQTSISFWKLLKLAIYAVVPMFVGTMFATLYSFSMLSTIGMCITFIYGMIISFNLRIQGGKNV